MQLPFAQDADPRPDIVIQELSPMTLVEGQSEIAHNTMVKQESSKTIIKQASASEMKPKLEISEVQDSCEVYLMNGLMNNAASLNNS